MGGIAPCSQSRRGSCPSAPPVPTLMTLSASGNLNFPQYTAYRGPNVPASGKTSWQRYRGSTAYPKVSPLELIATIPVIYFHHPKNPLSVILPTKSPSFPTFTPYDDKVSPLELIANILLAYFPTLKKTFFVISSHPKPPVPSIFP